MFFLRRTRLCLALSSRQEHASATLTSSTQLWAAAVQAFYTEYDAYTQHRTNVLRMTRAAEVAMQRCLHERRAAEALEVYATMCRCGVVGSVATTLATTTSSSSSSSPAAVSPLLDRLAQQALDAVPHRQCQHSMLSLLMAAEVDSPAISSACVYDLGATTKDGDNVDNSAAGQQATGANTSRQSSTVPPPLLPPLETLSAAERARIRVHQHLHTLHATQQLPQPLGKEYCLVEMQELCTGAQSTRLAGEMEVEPMRALAACVLNHPFTFSTPTAPWAQRELLWEADMRNSSSRGSSDAGWSLPSFSGSQRVAALAPADARRLSHIDYLVGPYRSLCASSLEFIATYLPRWDALFVRRVAETLVLPAEAHLIFPATYDRSRAAARRSGGGNGGGEHENVTASSVAPCGNAHATTWTDASTHQLFSPPDVSSKDYSSQAGNHSGARVPPLLASLSLTPMERVERIVKRRVHHDVVVPDTAYVLHHFHQLRQVARHREVIVTHAVFLEVVAAASLTAHPLRFHARRVLREVMYNTTTAITATKGEPTRGSTSSSSKSGRHISRSGAAVRKAHTPHGGFTLLGLQDELALLEHCPERFFLHDYADAEHNLSTGEGSKEPFFFSYGCSGKRGSSINSVSTGVSVVLVAKQLERMIAAHDRGDSFPAKGSASNSAQKPSGNGAQGLIGALGMQLDVDGLVSHLLDGPAENSTAAYPHHPQQQSAEAHRRRRREEPLFRNRSRGHWARLPSVVATTGDSTRAAAFQVGLSMYPPASVAP